MLFGAEINNSNISRSLTLEAQKQWDNNVEEYSTKMRIAKHHNINHQYDCRQTSQRFTMIELALSMGL